MRLKKCLSFLILILLCKIAASQDNTPITLKWKLKPGETVTYKTIMEDVDKPLDIKLQKDNLGKIFGTDLKFDDVQKVFNELNAVLKNANYSTQLKREKGNTFGIEMHAKTDSMAKINTGKLTDAQQALKVFTQGVVLRGAVYDEGAIASFYTKTDQKNLLAILFELPAGKQVKTGDAWPLSVNFISVDQNFKCDTSYRKNMVTLTDVKVVNGEKIAALKYDITEYIGGSFTMPFNNNNAISTTMLMSYQGLALFSIDRGRWIAYDGVMQLTSTGVMAVATAKKFSLVLQQ